MTSGAGIRRAVVLSAAAALAAACGSAPARPGARAAAVSPDDAPSFDPAVHFVIGRKLELDSNVLGERRAYWIYTPPGYATAGRRYPVMYLLDGDGHFHHVTGLVQFLANAGRAPPMIVVAVSNTDRTRDFTPTRMTDRPTSGGADAFLQFVRDELVPHVEQRYRVQPYRILVGHSLGGLFAIHALLSEPNVFDAYVSIAPSLWWDDQLMRRVAARTLPAATDLSRFLFVSIGTEGAEMMNACLAFGALLQTAAPTGLQWSFARLKREDHGSVPHRTVYMALETLYAGWQPPVSIDSAGALETHYSALSKRFGYEISPPEQIANQLGYNLLGANRVDAAIDVFELNVRLYPRSPNVYDSRGEAFERAGRLEEAARSYGTAVRLATEQDARFLDAYRRNWERAKAKAN